MDDVQCYGNESFLQDCVFNWWNVHNCGHGEDVSISCLSSTSISSTTVNHTTVSANATTPFVRLVGKPDAGRLEVFHDGQWGTVCENGFNDVAATVTCRSLGFGYGELINGDPYHTRNGTIWLDDVRCRGNEASILECSHSGWGQHHCEHSQNVAIECYHKSLTAISSYSTTFPVVVVTVAIVVGGVLLLAVIIALTCVLVKRTSRSRIVADTPAITTTAAAAADLDEKHDVCHDQHLPLSTLKHHQPRATENAYNKNHATASASASAGVSVLSTCVDEDGYEAFEDEQLYANEESLDLYENVRFQ
jgi:hypothetical protein